MNYQERYKRVFDRYYTSVISDKEVLEMMDKQVTIRRRILPRWAVVAASFILILSSVLIVGAATGWIDIASIFRDGFNDVISADLIEAGIVQELDIVNENDDFTLKLVAFTGDTETQKVMLQLIPKRDLGNFTEISIKGQTFNPAVLEEGKQNSYSVQEVMGFEAANNVDMKSYYFNYKLPAHWVSDLDDDVVLFISGVKLYSNSRYTRGINSDMVFQFSPDRSMLKEPVSIDINQPVTRDIYDYCSFTDNYENDYLYKGEIKNQTTEKTIHITNLTVSKYKAVIHGTIPEQYINETGIKDIFDQMLKANEIWNQFTEPRFLTKHFWKGIESVDAYDLAVVNNEERIRLFVDKKEMQVDEDSLKYIPGKGHDDEGNLFTEGDFGCVIEFEGFDYDKVHSVEIHAAGEIIKIK